MLTFVLVCHPQRVFPYAVRASVYCVCACALSAFEVHAYLSSREDCLLCPAVMLTCATMLIALHTSRLGKGAYGIVWRATEKSTGRTVVRVFVYAMLQLKRAPPASTPPPTPTPVSPPPLPATDTLARSAAPHHPLTQVTFSLASMPLPPTQHCHAPHHTGTLRHTALCRH